MEGILPQGLCLLNTAASRLFRLRKTVLNSARIITDRLAESVAGRKYRALFVTLTYAPGSEWKAGHIAEYMDRVKQWLKRQGVPIRYVWVAELQKRGAVHYHVMLWVPRHLTLPKSDRRGWWSHGLTNTQVARKPVGYMAKYASKLESKEGKFPSGIRLHGAAGLEVLGRAECRWWNYPKWVREKWPLSRALEVRKPLRGGGFIDPDTGEVEKSEYVRSIFVNLQGQKNVIFQKKDSGAIIPDWLKSCRAYSTRGVTLATSALSAELTESYRARFLSDEGLREQRAIDAIDKEVESGWAWWERFPACSSEEDYEIIGGLVAVQPYTLQQFAAPSLLLDAPF